MMGSSRVPLGTFGSKVSVFEKDRETVGSSLEEESSTSMRKELSK